MGLINYVHRFVPDLYKYIQNINKLTHKNVPYIWTQEHENDFIKLKEMIQKTNILRHPDFEKEFFIVCDASQYGMGGMLAQYDDKNNLQPIEFCSKLFNETQQRWHCSEQETYVVVYFIEK